MKYVAKCQEAKYVLHKIKRPKNREIYLIKRRDLSQCDDQYLQRELREEHHTLSLHYKLCI